MPVKATRRSAACLVALQVNYTEIPILLIIHGLPFYNYKRYICFVYLVLGHNYIRIADFWNKKILHEHPGVDGSTAVLII